MWVFNGTEAINTDYFQKVMVDWDSKEHKFCAVFVSEKGGKESFGLVDDEHAMAFIERFAREIEDGSAAFDIDEWTRKGLA